VARLNPGKAAKKWQGCQSTVNEKVITESLQRRNGVGIKEFWPWTA
jgi:hypothetical protein